MKVKRNSGDRVNPEPGTHIAILTQILDWGLQQDSVGLRRKVELVMELPDSLHVFNEEKGEQPIIVAVKYGTSTGRGSKLAAAIEGITGKKLEDLNDEDGEFDLETLLGKAFQISVTISKSGDYDNVEVGAYMPLSKNDSKRKFTSDGDLKVLDLDNFDEEVFASLPEWKQKLIAKSDTYKESVGEYTPPVKEEQEERPSKPVGKTATPHKTPAKVGGKDLFDRKKGKR